MLCQHIIQHIIKPLVNNSSLVLSVYFPESPTAFFALSESAFLHGCVQETVQGSCVCVTQMWLLRFHLLFVLGAYSLCGPKICSSVSYYATHYDFLFRGVRILQTLGAAMLMAPMICSPRSHTFLHRRPGRVGQRLYYPRTGIPRTCGAFTRRFGGSQPKARVLGWPDLSSRWQQWLSLCRTSTSWQ